ncbi:MAG: hypothetical protein K6G70_02830 [Bacteroidaceae bacterium]|nr:hypothetical protein [Bacteroidaceae bacterium]
MKRKLLFAAIFIASALGSNLFAQFDADKVYTIANNNDASMFMQDNGTGKVAVGSMNDNSYWKFVSTGNTDCYYIQNASTGKYIQGYTGSEQEVATGDNGVEYYVKADASGSLSGKYRMSCTANSPHDFSTGTLGLNWKGNNTVQSFASVAEGNPRSAWTVAKATMPDPVPTLSSPYAGNEIAAGDFFLYNVETGLWIQNNEKNTGDWNTRGATGTYGLDFAISAISGGWKLDPKFGNNHSINSSNFYLDTTSDVTAWTFEPKTVNGATNTYTIKAGGQVLGLDNNDNLAMGTSQKSTWQLVTREDRLAYLEANATEENPIDATFLIQDPGFANANDRASSWKWNRDGGNLDVVRWFRNRRSYAVWNSNSFSLTQTIENIPNGYYKLNVKGYYRDGDKDQCVERRAAGTENQIGKYFINNDKASLMSILDGASQTWVEGLFYYPNANDPHPYGFYPDNADGFNRVFQDYPNSYKNAGILSTVTTKTIKIGIEKLSANSKDWLAWDEFYLTYLGPIDVSEYITALNQAIATAEAFNGNTSTALASNLATALAEAKAVLSSQDTDVLSAKTGALNSALAAAQSVDITLLAATITFAEADGVDVSSANDVVANATSASQVNDALSALRLARRIANAETQADVFAGNTPAAGDYYLYNVGTGRFFCGGADWGAHAALGFPGVLVTLEATGTDNVYKLNTHLRNGDDNGNHKEYLNYDGYCDTWTSDSWKFVEVSTGVYNIVRSSNEANLLGYETATYNNVITTCATTTSPTNQWKLVTKADRDALLATATEQAPQDASYLIKSPNFSQREDVSAWTFTNASIWGRGGNHPDFAIEAYDKTSATVEQTVTGLPAGTYELKVQAFYRDGNFETQVNTLSNGGDARQLATLYAGTKSALIQNVSGGADKAPGMGRASTIGYMPDGIDDACLYFQSGLYWATLDEIVVGQDGTMTIGARKTEKLNDGDWMVLDNFRLIYKGSGIDLSGVKADLLAKIGDATDLLDNLDLNLSFLATAKANGQGVYDNSSDADEIVDATNALQTAINQVNAATDLTVFKQTMAKAQPEGVAVNVFKNAVEAVTDGSTFAATVSEQLYLLRSERKINALRMPDIYTGSAPAAGKVYLFNVGTGMFLGAGSDWNTHAAVDQVGIEVELVASGNGFIMKSAWGSFNNSPYVDTGANTVYTFQAVDGKDGVYNILEGSDLLGWNPNGKTDGKKYWNSISNVAGADANDANYQWKVITSAERKALLAQATPQNPVDVSYLINNPSHNRKADADYKMYTKVAPGGNGGARVSSQDDGNGDRAADFGYEFWNVDNLEWSQQLTGLTPGTYEVAVQGYYREGDGAYQTGVVNNGGTLLCKAYLKANDESAELQNIAYCLDGVPGVGTAVSNNGAFPNWPREAFEYFETGYYWTSVEVTVGNDGNLKIGVYKDSKTDNDWIVLDNFRLRLLSAATASATVKITDVKYATFIAPFDVEIPDGVTASTAEINENGTKLDLTDLVGTIPAHTAVILFSENTLTKEVSGVRVADPENLTTDALTGTYEDVQAPEGSYVLQNQAEGIGFYQVVYAEAKPWVRANRAYLTAPNNNVKAFILGESDADGIRSLENGFQGTHNGEIFNLAGQRMTKTQRGVNIVNKKKVVIK